VIYDITSLLFHLRCPYKVPSSNNLNAFTYLLLEREKALKVPSFKRLICKTP